MSKHTPGPWKASAKTVTKSDGHKIRIVSPSGSGDWDKTDERLYADAALVADAPALLEAADHFLAFLLEGGDPFEWGSYKEVRRLKKLVDKHT